jgi:NNP family nitrate/nitrite transporter-like MFS transporter
LLGLSSIPVMTVGLVDSYEGFLLFRLAIGVIGASFVVTQYHTSVMFDKKIVGTANAVAGGWGNLGGGITNMVMPLIFAGIRGRGLPPLVGMENRDGHSLVLRC